jgi:hypothetical protein
MPSSISSRVSGLRKAITNTARKVKKKLKSAVVVVAIEYREVVNSLTSDRLLNLRDCEISDSEWNIIDDTVYALKVSNCRASARFFAQVVTGFQGCNNSFFG